MEEVKSTTIVPIAIYCFILAFFFSLLGLNTIYGKNGISSGADPFLWFPVTVSGIFALGFIYVGVGFIHLKRSCWKILFFFLAICVSSTSSFILAYYVMLWIGINSIAVYFHLDLISPVLWYSSLAVFLSSIIVLYYLTHEEVVAAFGGIGDLISPI